MVKGLICGPNTYREDSGVQNPTKSYISVVRDAARRERRVPHDDVDSSPRPVRSAAIYLCATTISCQGRIAQTRQVY